MFHASSVLVAGSVNLDFVVRAVSIPVPGQTALGRDVTCCGVRVAALHRACAAAASTCTRPGAQTSIPQRAYVDAFLAAPERPC